MTVNTGDIMVAYVFLDPSNVPSEIMLQWSDGDWNHRAYWGANNISFGTDNTESRRYMGPMPAAGQWVRLEAPASQVGLENRTLNGMAFTLHGGRATWDRAGKTSGSTPTPTPNPTPNPTPSPTPTPTPISPLGESILRAKRDGQDLSNQLASSAGGSAAESGGASAQEIVAAETEALQQFIGEIQTAITLFTADTGIYPAAARIGVELNTALESALEAHLSSVQGNLPAVRTQLRETINHLELIGALISHPHVSNPIDVASYVVRQHYIDFLDREPDRAGTDYWTNQFAACGTDVACFQEKRIHVSAAFFLSTEFQQTGYFVHRLYKTSFRRVPTMVEFMPDTGVIGDGVIVGTAGWESRLAANKAQFLQNWVQRAGFVSRYSAYSDRQYVDTLIFNIAVTVSTAERDALVQDLANGVSRATVLGRLADHAVFSANEFNRAFVLMQYFGYLRRDYDNAGFTFWFNKLNEFGGNYQSADMVKAFLASQEYRRRFAL